MGELQPYIARPPWLRVQGVAPPKKKTFRKRAPPRCSKKGELLASEVCRAEHAGTSSRSDAPPRAAFWSRKQIHPPMRIASLLPSMPRGSPRASPMVDVRTCASYMIAA